MNLKLVSCLTILVLLLGVTSFASNHAFAIKHNAQENILKKDLKSIMAEYSATITKAKADFINAIEKSNANAKSAIQKGIPIDKINTASKASIEKARIDYKQAVEKAKADAKATLLQIVAALGQKSSKI